MLHLNLFDTEIAATVRVYNALGQQVFSETLHDAQAHVNMQALPNGVYTVVLQTEKGMASRLVIKE